MAADKRQLMPLKNGDHGQQIAKHQEHAQEEETTPDQEHGERIATEKSIARRR